MNPSNILLTFIFLTAFSFMTFGQTRNLWLDAETDNFAEIRRQVETYYEGRDQGRGTGYKQWKRWEYKMERRLLPDGRITNYTARNWEAFYNYLQEKGGYPALTTYGDWYSLGPMSFTTGNSGYNGGLGRCNVIAFHPTDVNIIYVGMPAGGLWKTTDQGDTWESMTDGMPVIGVSGIAVDYDDPDIVYLLAGDGDGGDTQTIGVLKTTDGGVTWYSTGLSYDVTGNVKGYKLAMHPNDSSILFAIMTDGLHKTVDGGITWTEVQSGSFRDLEFKPGNPTRIYASTTASFYRSSNTGDTWALITSGLPSGESRVALAVAPSSPDYVYYLAGPGGASGNGTFAGLYRSTDSGLNFSTRTTTPNILTGDLEGDDSGDQSSYDLAIAIDPNDANEVITGGTNIWRDEAGGGTSFSIVSHWNENTATSNGLEYTHADIHELVFQNDNSLWCGSDGGVFLSTDDGVTWQDKSDGLTITQFYRIAGYQLNTSLLIGGTQDNGSNKFTGSTDIEHIYGADGMDCMIDHSNSNVLYFSSQNGGLRKSTDGGDNSSSIKPSGATGAWVTPYAMDPSNSDIIYGGYSDIFRSTNGGSSWTNQGVDGRGAIAIGTNNPSRVYASQGSTIWMSNDAGASWSDVSAGLPGITITFIAVNPDNSPDVWVTLGDFNAGEKVYRSNNAGTTWSNISGTLPDCIVNCIGYEDTDGSPNDALYIGTDVGVFYRDDDLGDWIPFMNGLPSVPVFDLEINLAGLIRAGTYGRGIWTSVLYSVCPTNNTLTQVNDPSNPNYTGFQFYEASDYITSSRIITGGEGTDVTYRGGSYVLLTPGFHVRENNKFFADIGACTGGALSRKSRTVRGIYEGPITIQAAKLINAETRGLVEAKTETLPDRFDLQQNYPNPFNPVTTIQYALPKDVHVSLKVYDILGQEVITLVDEPQTAGYKSLVWDGRNESGESVASGLYIYRMTAGEFVQVQKMLYMK